MAGRYYRGARYGGNGPCCDLSRRGMGCGCKRSGPIFKSSFCCEDKFYGRPCRCPPRDFCCDLNRGGRPCGCKRNDYEYGFAKVDFCCEINRRGDPCGCKYGSARVEFCCELNRLGNPCGCNGRIDFCCELKRRGDPCGCNRPIVDCGPSPAEFWKEQAEKYRCERDRLIREVEELRCENEKLKAELCKSHIGGCTCVSCVRINLH